MLAVAVVFLCYGMAGHRSLSSHEIYTAVGAREMISSGDYIVPHQAGLPRLQKPPLGYWVIVGAAALTGQVDEFSARLPAGIAAILLCGLTGVWAGRWYGRDAGILAAFAQATTVFVVVYGRKAEVDMLVTLLNTAALFLIAGQPAGQSWKAGFTRWLGIFALLGLSTMSKFHYGPAMILAPCVVFWAIEKRWSDVKHGLNPVGWLLWLGPIVAWIALVLARMPNAADVWHRETIGRAVGELSSFRPLWFYLLPIFWMTLPWTPLWLAEAARSWREAFRKGNSRERFLWCWLLVQLAIVSLQPDKHPQYILSALPIFALWSGRRLARIHAAGEWLRFRWSRGQAVLLSLASIGGAVTLAWYVRHRWPWIGGWGDALGLFLGIGGVVSLVLTQWGRPRLALGTLAVTACGLMICGMGGVVPGRDHWRAQADFSERVREVAGDRSIAGFQLYFSPLYYLGPGLINHPDEDALRERLQTEGPLLLVAQERHLETLRELGDLEPVFGMTDRERKFAAKDHPLACWMLSPREAPRIAGGTDSPPR
jgi:4-amino-4-deoxy-L-arabinose transferase-like glycosyltransferase